MHRPIGPDFRSNQGSGIDGRMDYLAWRFLPWACQCAWVRGPVSTTTRLTVSAEPSEEISGEGGFWRIWWKGPLPLGWERKWLCRDASN